MRVEGEGVSRWTAVRLDSFESVEKGPLVMADTATGSVFWRDRAGELCQVHLGPRMVRLIERKR